jgi:hypothetical protein
MEGQQDNELSTIGGKIIKYDNESDTTNYIIF